MQYWVGLKQLQNYNLNYFLVCHKNRWKHKQHFKLLFFKIILYFSISDYLSIYGKLNFLPINSIYLVFSSLEMQRRVIQIKTHDKLFYSVWKESSHKPLKVAAAKNYFPGVYIIDITCFNKCFLFHVITWRQYFLCKLIVPQWFWCNRHVAAFFKTSVLKKSIFYIRYFHNNIAMLLTSKV